MKKWWSLAIVAIGTIGIMVYVIDDAFFSELTNPLLAIRLFRYFTILSNLIAVVYFWLLFSKRLQFKYRWYDHFIGGVAIYLFVTFVIYAVLLEGTYEQSALDVVGNVCLHYVNPALVVGYLIAFRKNFNFVNKDILIWFVYPIAYLVFLILHGVVTGDYLYSFFQVSEVGIGGLLSMIGILLAVFLLLSAVLVKIVSRK